MGYRKRGPKPKHLLLQVFIILVRWWLITQNLFFMLFVFFIFHLLFVWVPLSCNHFYWGEVLGRCLKADFEQENFSERAEARDQGRSGLYSWSPHTLTTKTSLLPEVIITPLSALILSICLWLFLQVKQLCLKTIIFTILYSICWMKTRALRPRHIPLWAKYDDIFWKT